MAVRGIAGNEDAAAPIARGDRVAQLPEAGVLDLEGKRKTGGVEQRPAEIEIAARRLGRHRGVEEETFADIDTPEEFPVTVQVRVHHAIGRSLGETLELLMQLARAEDDKHHDLIEIGAPARDAGRLAYHRMAAVAADQIVRLQRFGFARSR